MTELQDAILTHPWPSPDQVADRTEDKDDALGMLRYLGQHLGDPDAAAAAGKSVFEMFKRPATLDLRRAWATWINMAHMHRVIVAFYEDVGLPYTTVNETDYDLSRRYWMRVGVRKGWGDPDAAALEELRKMAQINWGCYRAPS